MRPIDWHINADGYVTGADVHDGRLAEFSFEERTFKVRIAGIGGGVSEFAFGGVTKLHADLVEEQIVYAVFAWKIGQTPEFSPHAEDNPWRQLAWPASDDDLPAFVTRLSRDNPGSYLLQISCSYGGDVALICRDIQVFDVS
ncbi:MAG TPA: hypothetical protein VEW26_04915 [Allosphingosinicella sp.]|nr:hypothetical protein [Allosphingosinicella sp.]